MSLGLCVCQVRLGSCVFGSLCVKLGWLAVSLGLCVCQVRLGSCLWVSVCVRLVSCVFGSLCVSG